MNNNDLKIGLIPFNEYAHIMNKRMFTPKRIIDYTSKTYDTNISDTVHIYQYWEYTDFDVYDEFEKESPPSKTDDGSRKYFTSIGRRRYEKFLDWTDHSLNADFLYGLLPARTVHHIFPLVFGGKSNIENLVLISDINHDILHLNPLEHIEKYCHQAVDYLSYLHRTSVDNIIKKYDLTKYNDDIRLAAELYMTYLKFEMKLFYDHIENEYNKFHKTKEGVIV